MMKAALSNRSIARKNVRTKRATLVALAGATAGLAGVGDAFGVTGAPITNITGWNVKQIYNGAGTVNAAFDSANDYDFYVSSAASSNYGLPASGLFNSATNSAVAFQFQPYTANNALELQSVTTTNAWGPNGTAPLLSGTINFATPTAYSTLSLLNADANGSTTISYTLTFNNGSGTTTAAGTFGGTDWFTTGGAIASIGRVGNALSGTPGYNQGTMPEIFENDISIPAADANYPLQSISFSIPVGSGNGPEWSLFAVSGAQSLIYTGTDANFPGVFNTGSGVYNFASMGTPTAFTTGAGVTFNDTIATAPNGGNVNIASGAVSPSLVSFQNSAVTYNFSGSGITGSTPVYFLNGGTVNFGQLNTYTGVTNISNGTVNVLSTGSLGTGAVIEGATSTLNLYNATQSIGGLTNAGLFNSSATTLTISGAVTNTGVFNASGTALTISGALTNSGSFNTTGTTLVVSGLVSGAGKFNLTYTNASFGSLSATGPVSLSGLNLNIGGGGTTTGMISGSSNILFTGSTTLSGSNSYVGTTNLSGATLTINNVNAFGPTTNLLNFNGSSTISPTVAMTMAGGNPLAYSMNVASGATLTIGGANSVDLTGSLRLLGNASIGVTTAGTVVTPYGAILGNVLLTKTGAGTLNLLNSSNGFTGVNLSAGVVVFASGQLGTTGIGSKVNFNGGTLQFAPGNTEDISTDYALNLNSGGGTINIGNNNITFLNGFTGTNLGAFTITAPVTGGASSLTVQGPLKATSLTTTGGSPSSPEVLNFNGPNAVFTQTSTTAGLGIGFQTGDYDIVNITNGAQFSILGGNNNGGLNLGDQANLPSTDGYAGSFGAINISSGSVFNSTSQVFIGKAGNTPTNTTTGVLNMMGGTFNASYATGPTEIGAANFGVGIFNISGTVATTRVNATTIELGLVAGSSGLLNLSGGTLSASNIYAGTGASTVILNGGTLNSNVSNGTILASTLKNTLIQGNSTTPGVILTNFNSSGTNLNSNISVAANLSSGVTGSADGGITYNSGTGALILSGNDSFTGPIVVGGNLNFSQAGISTFPGNISVLGNVNMLQAGTTTLTGTVTANASTGLLVQSGTGTTILGGMDSFPGGVNVTAGVLTLINGASVGGPITLTGGALGIGSDGTLAAYNVNNSGGAIQFNNYNSSLNFTYASTPFENLKLGAAAGIASGLAGNITGNINLIYIGPGTLNLTGSNTYAGYTNVSGGYLNFAPGSLGLGPVTLSGGVLQYSANNTTDLSAVNATQGGLVLGTAGGGIDVGSNNVTFAGNVSNGSIGTTTAFSKYGVGSLTLNGNLATYNTFVRAGTFSFVGPSANGSSSSYTSIGLQAGDVGIFSMDQGAKYTDLAGFNVADSSTAASVTTGVFNIADTTNQGTTLTTNSFYVGKGSAGTNYNNAVGTVNQTGGTVRLNASAGSFYVGSYGSGTYNQSGGNVIAGAVTVAANTGSIGVYNLNGGNLTTTQLLGGSGVSSTVNFNGGTVIANASSTSFITGLTKANISTGGLVLNTNGFSTTIPQTFASGVAGPALDGGLVKTGAGTLTLSGTNTFTGGVNVSQGTVVAPGTALGTGTVKLNGGTLSLLSTVTSTTTGTAAFSKLNAAGSFTPTNTGSVITLTTNGTNNDASSAFVPLTINDAGTFSATFTWVHTTGTTGSGGVADGISYGFQADPRGLSAIGGNGGGEGYAGVNGGTAISPSEVGYFEVYNYGQYGTGTNGSLALNATQDNNILNDSGQVVTVSYNGPSHLFTASFVDGAGTTITQTLNADLVSAFGGTAGSTVPAYFGFTGGTGGGGSMTSQITNLSYTSSVPGSAVIANNVVTTPGTTSGLTFQISPTTSNGGFGTLTMGALSTLDITTTGSSGVGYNITAGAVTLTGTDIIDIANPTGGGSGNLLLGALSDNGVAAALTLQDSGIVTLTAPASLVAGSTVTIAGTTTLALNNATALGSASLYDNGTLTLGAGIGNTTVNFGAPYFNNVILNGNTLTIATPGTLAALSITDGTPTGGSVNIASGTVTYVAPMGYTGPTGVASGATLILGATQAFAGLNGGGTVNLNGTTLTVGNSTSNLSSNFSGVISDGNASGGVTVGGTGTLSLYGVNTYTGTTTVNTGATLNVYGSLASTGAVTTSGTVNFEANTSGGIYARTKGMLTINQGGLVTVGYATPHTSRTFLTVSGLSIAGPAGAYTGTLDLSNNDLDVQNGTLGVINGYVAQGYAGGTWQGPGGIVSTAAKNDSSHLTALGVILNAYNLPGGGVAPLYGAGTTLGLFDGANPAVTDVLVKYTYYGDTNLDGKVDGSDYSNIDAGFSSVTPLTGWANGDFNYDGVIDGSDYTLIDNAFNSQGAALTATVAAPSALVGGGGSAVPEPTSLGLLAIGAVGLLGRRRSHR